MSKATVSNLDGIRTPALEGDVGFDLIAATDPKIVGEKNFNGDWTRIDYIEYDTGVKVNPPQGFFTMIIPRSSLSKYDLVLANSVGVIDPSYKGNLIVRFKYIIQPKDLVFKDLIGIQVSVSNWSGFQNIYKKGDKIAQLVFMPVSVPTLEVGEVGESERGEGGFGSTGL